MQLVKLAVNDKLTAAVLEEVGDAELNKVFRKRTLVAILNLAFPVTISQL